MYASICSALHLARVSFPHCSHHVSALPDLVRPDCRGSPDGSADGRGRAGGACPKLDGTLNDPLWLNAKPITDFRQREPFENKLTTEETEVRILYTRHAVYFGIRCHDSQASRIVATELRRDVSQDLDDHFEILIDSNHDRRGAYVFEVNPLGTQSDGLIVGTLIAMRCSGEFTT